MDQDFLELDDNHPKSIVHIDIDCFYAQVEMLQNPDLRSVPLGIQQKNIIVTSNYEARKHGIKKCMLVLDGLKICPNLTLVRGEDLHNYRTMSNKVFTILQSYNCPVEKLGMDENFIDVTELVNQKRNQTFEEATRHSVIGCIYENFERECACGCHKRLNIASAIAGEIRNKIFNELGLTTSAGIGTNKLLAKLVGPINKPNDQTTIYPASATKLLLTLESVRNIPGIGLKTAEVLLTLGIKSVLDLQNIELSELKSAFSSDMAVRLKQLSFGNDTSDVKQSGKPSSIGLEDSFRTISVQSEVEERFKGLLKRLMALVQEDGRIPVTLKVTLRKKDLQRMSSHRETRQCQISPSVFSFNEGSISLSDAGFQKLLIIIMRLFHKLVDLSKPFHLTLLGLAFTKFKERMAGKSSIVNYFMNDISVQSVLNLQNDCEGSSSSMECSIASPGGSTNTDLSEGEAEPSPKKAKRVSWIARKRCFSQQDVASPSKLRVADLRLNSKDLEKVSELRLNSRDMDVTSIDMQSKDSKSCKGEHAEDCPADVDKDVFNELPEEVKSELRAVWRNKTNPSISQNSSSKPKSNTILRYFIPNK